MSSVLCRFYMGGNIVNGNFGIDYDKPCARVTRIPCNITYDAFLLQICTLLKIARDCIDSLLYRFPTYVTEVSVIYGTTVIEDDDGLQLAIQTTMQFTSLTSMEVYVNVYDDRMNVQTIGSLPSAVAPLSEEAGTSFSNVAVDAPSAIDDSRDDEFRDNEPIVQASIPLDSVALDIPFPSSPSNVATPNGIVSVPVPSTVLPPFTKKNTAVRRNTDKHKILVPRWQRGCELQKGMEFANKKELTRAVQEYSIDTNHTYRVKYSTSKLFIVHCSNKENTGCPWRVRAIFRRKVEMWRINQYDGSHICTATPMSEDHKAIDNNLIAESILDLVGGDPDCSIDAIRGIIKDKFGYQPSYRKLWMGKIKAMERVHGYSSRGRGQGRRGRPRKDAIASKEGIAEEQTSIAWNEEGVEKQNCIALSASEPGSAPVASFTN